MCKHVSDFYQYYPNICSNKLTAIRILIQSSRIMTTGLYIASAFKPRIGGIEEHTYQIVKHLTELGEKITVLTPSLPGDSEFDSTCGYPVVRYGPMLRTQSKALIRVSRGKLFAEIFRMAFLVRPSYLICDRWDPITGGNLVLISILTGIPFFMFAHGTEFVHPLRRWYSRLSRELTIQNVTRVICVSETTHSLVSQLGMDPSKIVTIYNGFDMREIELYRRRNYAGRFPNVDDAFPEGHPSVLTVSRLVTRKGVDKVIQAMPQIVAEVPGTRYIIVGDGEDEGHLKRMAANSPARDAITFLGPLTGDDKFECYARCDLFAMPSRFHEGFPVVFSEASAFRKPIVGGNLGGQTEAVSHGETGLLVDPNDVYEITEAIVELLKNPDVARRLGDNGKRKVESVFNWKASASRLLSVIHDALDE